MNKASTSIGVVAAPANPLYGRDVLITATVSPVSPGAGVPTNTATFTVDGNTAGAQTVNVIGGQASITLDASGKVLIQGVDIVSKAKAGNRIKGASVRIN